MPLDIPQLKEALVQLQGDPPKAKHAIDDGVGVATHRVMVAARAVVEAPTIQWCTTHGERASMQWPDNNWQCHYQGVCRVEPRLLVDPGSQP